MFYVYSSKKTKKKEVFSLILLTSVFVNETALSHHCPNGRTLNRIFRMINRSLVLDELILMSLSATNGNRFLQKNSSK